MGTCSVWGSVLTDGMTVWLLSTCSYSDFIFNFFSFRADILSLSYVCLHVCSAAITVFLIVLLGINKVLQLNQLKDFLSSTQSPNSVLTVYLQPCK